MIIDLHTHIDEVPALGWSLTAGAVIGQMDATGIERAVVMAIGDAGSCDDVVRVARAAAEHPDRLIPFVRVHPWSGEAGVALLRDCVTRHGFRGLKLHPVTNISDPGGDATVRLVEAAAGLGVPTLFHSGDDCLVTPWEIAECARRCPGAQVVLGHTGGYAHTADALDVAEMYPNVYLETSAMPYPVVIRDAVDRIGAQRVIFATDGPGCAPVLELEKIRLAGLSEQERPLVLGRNAARLLGLEAA